MTDVCALEAVSRISRVPRIACSGHPIERATPDILSITLSKQRSLVASISSRQFESASKAASALSRISGVIPAILVKPEVSAMIGTPAHAVALKAWNRHFAVLQ
jgi:hypothetical protein